MHIHQDILASAVALAVGMNIGDHDKVFEWAENNGWGGKVFEWAENNGWGGIELYLEVANVAALAHELMIEAAGCADYKDESFPGVFAYEVTEELGTWLAYAMRSAVLPSGPEAPGELTNYTAVRHELGRLALKFFDQSGRAIPATEEIIERLTGYVRPA